MLPIVDGRTRAPDEIAPVPSVRPIIRFGVAIRFRSAWVISSGEPPGAPPAIPIVLPILRGCKVMEPAPVVLKLLERSTVFAIKVIFPV